MSSRYESKNDWTFALMARDITTTFNAWSYNFTDAEEEIFLQTNNEIPQNSLELTLPKFIFVFLFFYCGRYRTLRSYNWLDSITTFLFFST